MMRQGFDFSNWNCRGLGECLGNEVFGVGLLGVVIICLLKVLVSSGLWGDLSVTKGCLLGDVQGWFSGV